MTVEKDYETFVERMNSFDIDLDNMFQNKTDEIEHYGVKGMKWGVRRVKDRVSSAKQERATRNIDQTKLSGAELKKRVDRLQNEAHFQRLSKSLQGDYNVKALKKAATLKFKDSKDLIKTGQNYRSQYYNRSKLSDDQLKKKVNRLQLEDRFEQISKQMTKDQRQTVNGVIDKASKIPVGPQYSTAINLAKMVNDMH